MSEPTTETGERKDCRYCAERIKAEARLCPFCGHAQKAFYLPLNDLILIGLALAVGASVWICFALLSSKRDFGKFHGQLIVLDSKVNVDNSKEKRVSVVGLVTNQTPRAWEALDFEVRFYGTNGELIDVATGRDSTFTIQGTDDHSFNLLLYTHHLKPGYTSHKVLVQGAKEPSDWW